MNETDWKAKSEDYWRQHLTEQQYYVTREHGTERPFTGELHDNNQDGEYQCVCCRLPLFDAAQKFDSGTGWPSYWDALNKDCLRLAIDRRLFTKRVEVLCSRCDAHLGHVFDDGPPPTNKRYCINTAALVFQKRNE